MEREIAKIVKTTLGYEDHGILTFFLHLEYGGGGQGAGGYALDRYSEMAKRRVGTEEGCEFIIRVLRACGVSKWEDLKGRTIFALRDEGYGSLIRGIENLPTEKGERFEFADIAEGVPA